MRIDALAVVVNDDPTQLAVLSGLVNKAGLTAQPFADAESALAAMLFLATEKETLPAVVVADLHMPVIDGWKFCRLLHSREYAPLNAIPILMASATFSGAEPARIAAALGAEGFVAMPVDGEAFVRLIREIIQRKETRKPLRALVVESDAVLSDQIRQALDANGYLADAAPTADEAVLYLDRVGCDLAVIDHLAADDADSGLIGKATSEHPQCVVIATTAASDPERAVRWMKQGVAACLRKPFDPERLIETCRGARWERLLMRAEATNRENAVKLQEKERLHRAILHSAMDGYWLSDGEGRILEVNEAYCRMSGYSERELLAMTISDLDINENGEDVRAHKRKVEMRGGDRFEARHRRKDGSVYDVEVNAHYLSSPGGLFVSFLHDISKRKRSLEALTDSERKWRNIVADAPQIGVGLNREGKIVFANRYLLELTGWTEAEVIGRDWFDMFIPDAMRDTIRRVFSSVIETSDITRVGRHENEIVARNGERFNIDWANVATLDGQGNIAEVTSLGIDLTERLRAAEALKKSEERLRLALRGADLGIWDWDIPGRAVVFNERWAEMVGYAPGELASSYETLEGLVHPDDLPMALDIVEKHLRGESDGMEQEFRMRHKSGRWVWVFSRGQVIARDADNRALRACGTHLDITARKEAQEEKESLEAQLAQAQKMESVGRLAGGVAHDFNNMLGVILGHAEIALAYDDASDRYSPHLREIQKAARRSAELTRQLLAFARKETIAPRAVDLNACLEGMLKMLRRLMGEDIALVWQPCATVPWILIDPSQLDQTLANLCVNARDAIAGTGVVAIQTGCVFFDSEACRRFPESRPGDYAVLSISDDGCGMDDATLQKIFDPFFTTKEMGRGTGLGLATVYGIVRQNAGFIDVASRPDEGTTFTIYLPLCGEPSELPQEQPPSTPTGGGGATVLVVEDETANLDVVCEMLKGLGHRALPAATPGEALALMERHAGEIDLLLADMIMPEMNGRELAGRILERFPRTSVLFMSGYTADALARGGGIDPKHPFIRKPFSARSLSDKIRKALKREDA